MTYIIKTASAQMPSGCWGRYGKVAVIETDGLGEPAMISARARHCRRIVRLWDRQHMGGPRSAYQLALRQAEALLAELEATERLTIHE